MDPGAPSARSTRNQMLQATEWVAAMRRRGTLAVDGSINNRSEEGARLMCCV